jgi:hypothetical protein
MKKMQEKVLTDYQDLFFKVEREKLYTSSHIYTGRDALLNANTGSVLGIVSDKYQVIEHKEVLGSFMKLMGDREDVKIQSVRSVKDGAKFYMTAEIDKKVQVGVLRDGSPDIIKPMLVLSNSYDESTKVGFIAGIFRLICSNGAFVGIKAINLVRKHLGEIDFYFSRGLAEGIDLVENRMLPRFQTMVDARIDQPRVELIKQSLPERLIKNVGGDRALLGQTEWDGYNMFTKHLTHEYKGSFERQMDLNGALVRAFNM